MIDIYNSIVPRGVRRPVSASTRKGRYHIIELIFFELGNISIDIESFSTTSIVPSERYQVRISLQ